MVNEQRLLDTFLELVQTNSESGNEGHIQAQLKGKFEALGLSVVEDQASQKQNLGANNLICTLPSTIDNKEIDKVYFTSHMDTVVPGIDIKPQIKNDGYIYSDGTTILGADDKAGLAAILEALAVIHENKLPHGQLQFVITVGEEIGLEGAKALPADLLDSNFGYAVDASAPVGTTVVGAPTQMKFDATIYGKTAHASVPDKGISAINIAAKAVSDMKLGRIDEVTTANIGRFEGGSATNIVADKVTLKAEARSHSDERIAQQIEHMKSVVENTVKRYGTNADIEITKSYPGFKVAEDAKVTEIAKESAIQLGLAADTIIAGGGSDGNIINGLGIPTVILGVGYENIHTTSERMPITSLNKLSQQILKIIEIVTNNK
ncbi:M20/M25/M40 family metallo-hydrolase [Staphylococcus gallinarum]|uniref:M20/M25/M40 family metallo-hydrolase n=1 Tax=Staphylococcus gallinarum TaxID=1293 RepID=UPI001E33149A|nr:M20/M25/M40 family metallo-hydrolase [Staphylococcus gallinarum]MCD8899013.1 M20/M25/M40 family metallo-hydrolase [Staphylococcus gallinarum]MCD8902202.1 M20/M25/M40 family metallo-hydrolase [Staphylococcus gallinarum]MEB6236590.1 M20/M25/M40 family metallo-hydrolase [Staphylococcus gallinarum]